MENKVIYVPVSVQEEPSIDNLIKELKRIRAYFGEHDKTISEHVHFDTMNHAINFLNGLKRIELPSEEEIHQAEDAFYKNDVKIKPQVYTFRSGINYILSIINLKK